MKQTSPASYEINHDLRNIWSHKLSSPGAPPTLAPPTHHYLQIRPRPPHVSSNQEPPQVAPPTNKQGVVSKTTPTLALPSQSPAHQQLFISWDHLPNNHAHTRPAHQSRPAHPTSLQIRSRPEGAPPTIYLQTRGPPSKGHAHTHHAHPIFMYKSGAAER